MTAPYERWTELLDEGQQYPDLNSTLSDDGVVLECGADLRPAPIQWLWKHWLALGKLHILAGAPGTGKTTLAIGLAATVTVGGRFPDGSTCDSGNVLVWSGEDDAADTLLPRLLACGGDPGRFYSIKGTRRDGELLPFDPARDVRRLHAAIAEVGGIKLLIVDPVVSAVSGDSHKNTEVRRALQPLVDLASACNCAVLGITHFSKGGQGFDPAQRVVGSVAFTAVARVVMVAAKVKSEDNQDTRILARSKSNIGPDDGGFNYFLEQVEPLAGISASRVAWGVAVNGSARELLTDPGSDPADTEEKSALEQAEDFLVQVLADGPAPSKHVETEAKAAGISFMTVRRAATKLGIKKRKSPQTGAWYWEKPNLIT